ncbi:MAG: hypothetical protein Q8O15_06490 [Rectinemataceae bacterium]|nr:hypothetical protein [Rectinemataceae bacterium]
MKSDRTTHSTIPGSRGKNGLPLFLSLDIMGCAVATIIALLRQDIGFSIALGDALVIEALVLLGIAWVGYLKKDGIRFWPRRSAGGASAPESWKDRVPVLGEVPLPPPPAPDENGPESPEYQRLAAAEEALRKRIVGGTGSNRTPAYIRDTALAGSILLLLGLCFEYLIPAL